VLLSDKWARKTPRSGVFRNCVSAYNRSYVSALFRIPPPKRATLDRSRGVSGAAENRVRESPYAARSSSSYEGNQGVLYCEVEFPPKPI
jgi:hypothetical protein